MFLEIHFFSLFTTKSGKFSKFVASTAILSQIKVFCKNIGDTTLASYSTKVAAPPLVLRD